jgi:peptidoglycan/LPS O-acetylase OafA/YrhL
LQTQKYYPNLEVLRGLAALSVAVGHSYIALVFNGVDELWSKPIWAIPPGATTAFFAQLILLFANGTAAVTVFFVVSGVVLGLSLDAMKGGFIQRNIEFLFKRIVRIYPAHFCVLVVIFVGITTLNVVNHGIFENTTIWYNRYYRHEPNLQELIKNLLLFNVNLNPVAWSLRVEVVAALFLPTLHYISRIKFKNSLALQFSILFFLIFFSVKNYGGLIVMQHLYKFYLGLLLPIYAKDIIHYFAFCRIVIPRHMLVGVMLISLLIERQMTLNWYPGFGVLQSVASTVLVYLLMNNSGGWLFRLKLLQQLGRFSYSFYLWHFPVLWFLYYSLYSLSNTKNFIQNYPFFMATAVCAVSICLAYFAAVMTFHLIEYPALTLGRNCLTNLKNKHIQKGC